MMGPIKHIFARHGSDSLSLRAYSRRTLPALKSQRIQPESDLPMLESTVRSIGRPRGKLALSYPREVDDGRGVGFELPFGVVRLVRLAHQ